VLLPHGVADQDDALTAASIVVRREIAAEYRPESKSG